VPVDMPDEMKGSGGTPFVPDGTGTTGVGSVVVADDDTDPEPPGGDDGCGAFGDAAGVVAGLGLGLLEEVAG